MLLDISILNTTSFILSVPRISFWIILFLITQHPGKCAQTARDDLDLFCAKPFGLLHHQKDEDLTSGEDCTNPLITKGS